MTQKEAEERNRPDSVTLKKREGGKEGERGKEGKKEGKKEEGREGEVLKPLRKENTFI